MVTKIVVSGTKVTVKQSNSVVTLLSSIKSKFIQPAKGSQNPEHIQYGLPKSVTKMIKQENKK